jgi:hypothetical protein
VRQDSPAARIKEALRDVPKEDMEMLVLLNVAMAFSDRYGMSPFDFGFTDESLEQCHVVFQRVDQWVEIEYQREREKN